MNSSNNDVHPLVLDDGWTIDSIENSLQHIVDANGAGLQLRKNFVKSRRGAIYDAARLQLLATWARRTQQPFLHYHNANKVELVLSELCDYAPGIATLRLCGGVWVGGQFVSRRDALMQARDKMKWSDSLNWRRIIKGRTIDFTFVSGSNVQYLSPFFTSKKAYAVKNKAGMYKLLCALSERVATLDISRIPSSLIEACAVFASELIKNTQEHATRDHLGRPYLEHVEGVVISWDRMPRSRYGEDFSAHPLLSKFWNHERVLVNNGKEWGLRCLQLSFFDTGPGFASRETGKPVVELALDDERKAILKSLKKNASTKAQTGSGNGLPEVLKALRQIGGLIMIRSGRLRLFNVFEPGEDRDLFEFDDWSSHSLAPVAGAVISLLIPIRR